MKGLFLLVPKTLVFVIVMVIVPAFAKCPKGMRGEYVRLRAGERLSDFAARVGVELSELKAWNGSKAKDGAKTLLVCRTIKTGSIGRPSKGKLVGGVSIDPDGDREGYGYVLGAGRTRLFGTPIAVAGVKNCAARYRSVYPKGKGPPINIGDLSARHGGPAGPHVSHQSGRDVDIGYLTIPPQSRGVFDREATAENLDVPKQWILTECFINPNRSPNVKVIFISETVTKKLRDHVEKIYRKNPAMKRRYLKWMDERLRPDQEHLTHMHVRFRCAKSDKSCVD